MTKYLENQNLTVVLLALNIIQMADDKIQVILMVVLILIQVILVYIKYKISRIDES